MSDFARVKDPDTGHKFTMATDAVPKSYTVLDEDAVDSNSRPLPPEYAEPKTTKSAANTGKEKS